MKEMPLTLSRQRSAPHRPHSPSPSLAKSWVPGPPPARHPAPSVSRHVPSHPLTALTSPSHGERPFVSERGWRYTQLLAPLRTNRPPARDHRHQRSLAHALTHSCCRRRTSAPLVVVTRRSCPLPWPRVCALGVASRTEPDGQGSQDGIGCSLCFCAGQICFTVSGRSSIYSLTRLFFHLNQGCNSTLCLNIPMPFQQQAFLSNVFHKLS